MDTMFDLIVIGTGSAGSGVARRCRSAGWKVAIVDSRPYGGTCAQRGCDPKKVLVGAAEAVYAVRRLSGQGVGADAVAIQWADLARFKRTFTDPVAARSEKGFAAAGIETLHGHARFVDGHSIRVGERVISARHIHIATGAMPAALRMPGEELLTSSDQFLELTERQRPSTWRSATCRMGNHRPRQPSWLPRRCQPAAREAPPPVRVSSFSSCVTFSFGAAAHPLHNQA